jgi:putative intracellular protease/amidase
MTGRVLIVVSGADRVPLTNGKFYTTGFWLSELAEPLKHFYDAGMDVDFTSPEGKKPSVDPNSLRMISSGKRDELLKLIKPIEELRAPIPLDKITPAMVETYAGIFIPGGHAPMVDLKDNPDLGRILTQSHLNNKPTIAICHGPAGLLSSFDPNGNWTYKGYNMTCYSNLEEQILEHTGVVPGPLPYYVADELRKRGANVKNSLVSFIPHVVRDKELLTGQDPFAADKIGAEAVDMIRHWIGEQAPWLSKPYPW